MQSCVKVRTRKLLQSLWGTVVTLGKANGITPPQQLALGWNWGQSDRQKREMQPSAILRKPRPDGFALWHL